MIKYLFVGLFFINSFVIWEKADNTTAAKKLTITDRTAALKVHNDARADVGLPALIWSDDLATDAAEWAQNMAEKDKMYHSSNDLRPNQGENLYYTTATDTEKAGQSAAQAWYNEIHDFTYAPIGSGKNNFPAIGHYTQMVWKSTTAVGMALAVSKSGATYVVARYSPPGNWQGEKPY